MRRIPLLLVLLCASPALWAEADLLLRFRPLEEIFTIAVETRGCSLGLSYDAASKVATPSVSLGPFRAGRIRIVVKETTFRALRTGELYETRIGDPESGSLSLFRGAEGRLGLGFERGAFSGMLIGLPPPSTGSVFLPHRIPGGLTFLLRYEEGPVGIRIAGSEHTPLSLQVEADLRLGAVAVHSALDASEFPYRLTLGLEGENASLFHEFAIGREPVYSGSGQVLKATRRSEVKRRIGPVLLGFDHILVLQTDRERMVRTDLRLRFTVERGSERILLTWRERDGWSLEAKGRRGTVMLSEKGVAYEFIASLGRGEVRIALTSKGVFSIAYAAVFTIGQDRRSPPQE